MTRLLIVVEETPTGYSAHAPDLPGCVATGVTRVDVEVAMRDALAFDIEGLRAAGFDAPASHSYAIMVDVAA